MDGTQPSGSGGGPASFLSGFGETYLLQKSTGDVPGLEGSAMILRHEPKIIDVRAPPNTLPGLGQVCSVEDDGQQLC